MDTPGPQAENHLSQQPRAKQYGEEEAYDVHEHVRVT